MTNMHKILFFMPWKTLGWKKNDYFPVEITVSDRSEAVNGADDRGSRMHETRLQTLCHILRSDEFSLWDCRGLQHTFFQRELSLHIAPAAMATMRVPRVLCRR